MHGIHDRVEAVRSRQQRQWLWQVFSVGLVVGGLIGCLLGIARLLGAEALSLTAIATAVVACPVAGLFYGLLIPRRLRQAAVAIDRQYRFKDRIATALNFMGQSDPSLIRELQIDDAAAHVAAIDPAQVAPYRTPRSCAWGISLSAAALVIAFLSGPARELDAAAVVPNDVVLAQAARVAEDLEELEEFNQEDRDPEIEELLRELAEKIEELQQPGVDPKEALATLSEMEAALEAKQQQLADPGTEAALQAIGEALSLAEPFAAAGEAMAKGDMEKAAEELEKLEMPELDRQTERALTEKLEQAQQDCSKGAQRQLKEAAGQVCSGLCQGDRSKFKEGMKGLAGQCKKQGRRKKLCDLLRKQCQGLCECKSECESACKKTGESKGKGGDNWGLGASGNEPGDKTGKLKTGTEMKITGMESEGGDSEIETVSTPEQQQDAVRQYRAKVDKYEQISESVLDSEPIPLGHRQTIRRYFEMIRPQGGETDAVVSETNDAPQK